MRIKITEYWNKIIDDSNAPFGTRVLPEYEVKRTSYINGNLDELKKRYEKHSRMTIYDDKIVEDRGKYYGIHSFIEICRD